LEHAESVRPTRGPAENRRRVGWIWTRLGKLEQGEDELLRDDLRIEWCKSKARADRWSEEVLLLLEEMKRVQRFFLTQASIWDQRVSAVFPSSEDIAEGRRPYSHTQHYDDTATVEGKEGILSRAGGDVSWIIEPLCSSMAVCERSRRVGYGSIIPEEVKAAERDDGRVEEDGRDEEDSESRGDDAGA